MSGLRVAHYVFDVHYNEPTRVYAVVDVGNGDLRMDKIYEQNNMPLAELPLLWQHLDPKRPVVLMDPHPRIMEEFKAKGIRVR